MTEEKSEKPANPKIPNATLSDKLDKSDPLRYRQTVTVITTPIASWIAIAITTSVGFLAWSALGKIPETTTSNGVITNPFQIVSIPQAGQTGGAYSEIFVKPGDQIRPNQILAKIRFNDLIDQVSEAEAAYNQALDQFKVQYQSSEFRQLQNQQENGVRSSDSYFNAAKEVFNTGSISKSTVLNASQQYEQAVQNQLQTTNEIVSARSNLAKLKGQLDSAKLKLDQQSLIRSNFSGEVIALFVTPGEQNNPSASFIQVNTRPSSRNAASKTAKKQSSLSFVSYFTPTAAAQLKLNQKARILPSNVKPNTVGTLLGRIRSISTLPVTTDQVTSMLGSESLATQLLANGQTIQVIIDLIPSSNSVSGFEWVDGNGPSSSKPNQFPRIGVLGSVSVVTDYVPPITIGIPALKRFFGISS
jgi:HlyD family secretion protein